MGVRYMIYHWAINRTDPQNSLSTTLDVPLHVPHHAQYDQYDLCNQIVYHLTHKLPFNGQTEVCILTISTFLHKDFLVQQIRLWFFFVDGHISDKLAVFIASLQE